MMKSKYCLILLAALVLCAMSMSSCTQDTTGDATTAPTSAATVTTAPTAAPVTPEPPARITLFMSNSGITVPETVDPASNMYIDLICEMANVEIAELIMPPYSDFQTRLNLMLSSSEITDLVHNYYTADINKAGAAGAFMECSQIIADSPVISAIYTEQMLDSIRYSDGNIYHIRAISPPDPNCICVRYDLIKELNEGVIPTTLDEWYEVFVKEKETYPDSIPLTDYGITQYTGFIFLAYGVEWPGNGWQYTFGEFIHSFEAVHMREAILFYKKLYDEGLLSPTFATNVSADAGNERFTKKTIVWGNNLASGSSIIQQSGNLIDNSAWLVPATVPVTGLSDIDPQNAIPRINALNWGHNVAINSQTESPEGCVRFIETLLSDEVAELFTYGIEGVDFEVVDGANVLQAVAADPDHSFRLIYGFMQGYNSRASIDNRITQGLIRLQTSNANKAEIKQKVDEQTAAVYAACATVPSLTAKDFVTLSEEYVNKVNEGKELARAIIFKAIMGEISMDEYDAQVAAFLTAYQSVTDEYNRVLAEVNAEYNFD